jgi:hypothetical protein
MQHGRDHQEREQKYATRVAEQLRREDPDALAQSLTPLRPKHPVPPTMPRAATRERHASASAGSGHGDRPRR